MFAYAAVAFGQPAFVQTPPGDQTSLWTSPNTWDTITFTVTATKSDTQGISSWDLEPILDGLSVTGGPTSGFPYDEVTWNISWTPTHDHQGSVVLLLKATDSNGTGAHPVTIHVERKDLPTGGTDVEGIYSDLEITLQDFESYLDSADPAVEQVYPQLPLRLGQSVIGTSSLDSNSFLSWNVDHYEPDPEYTGQMKDQIDRIVELGVEVIKMNTSYPIFTDAFNDWAANTVNEWTYTDIGCEDIHENPGGWGDPASGATGDPEVWEPGIDVAWSKEEFILFYKELVNHIRSKGKKVYITHNTLKWTYSNINSLGYFDMIKEEEGWDKQAIRARYRQERAAEFAFVSEALQPDYLLILTEAQEQNKDFGELNPPGGPLEDIPLFMNRYLPGGDPFYDLAWGAYVDDAIAAFEAIPGGPPPSELGVCMATWDVQEAADSFITAYARHEYIDYLDWHLFPGKITRDLGTPDELIIDPLKNLVAWTNQARALNPAVNISVGECWLHKAKAADYGLEPRPSSLLIYARDNYSYWAPLDQKYLEVMGKVCKRKNIDLLNPWWGPYFYYDYLAYDELPTDHGAPDWNPPMGYDLRDIQDDECAGLALFTYYRNPDFSTWWADPTTGRLAENRLTLTGEKFKILTAEEICDNGMDDDFDALTDGEDPDCIVDFVLQVNASYEAGTLDMAFVLGIPEPALWMNYLVLTNPILKVIPLWSFPLLAIHSPESFQTSLQVPGLGMVGLWTGLYTEAGQQAFRLVWVDTGS